MFTLTRTSSGLYGIFGKMVADDNSFSCVTLEHAYPAGTNQWAPKIPVGTYTCVRRLSPKFGYDVFMLKDVPGHDYVEIHIGNYNSNSDGCILLGEMQLTGMISESRTTFERFMSLLTGVDEFTLVVV